jgi:hypothetical protein
MHYGFSTAIQLCIEPGSSPGSQEPNLKIVDYYPE